MICRMCPGHLHVYSRHSTRATSWPAGPYLLGLTFPWTGWELPKACGGNVAGAGCTSPRRALQCFSRQGLVSVACSSGGRECSVRQPFTAATQMPGSSNLKEEMLILENSFGGFGPQWADPMASLLPTVSAPPVGQSADEATAPVHSLP